MDRSPVKERLHTKNGIKDDGYYRVDGKPLQEKQTKWLQDDYVKFIRFGQWKIDPGRRRSPGIYYQSQLSR